MDATVEIGHHAALVAKRERARRLAEVQHLEDDRASLLGQIVGRILAAKRIPFVALDSSAEHVDFVRKFGNEIYYGDASRLELRGVAYPVLAARVTG